MSILTADGKLLTVDGKLATANTAPTTPYMEVEYVAVEYPPTSEIMKNLRDLEAQINQEMDELEKLLDK